MEYKEAAPRQLEAWCIGNDPCWQAHVQTEDTARRSPLWWSAIQKRAQMGEGAVPSSRRCATAQQAADARATMREHQEQQGAPLVEQDSLYLLCSLMTQVVGQNAQQMALLQRQRTQDQGDRWARLKFPEFKDGEDVGSYLHLFEATAHDIGLPEDQFMGVLR
ncbi:UNVERIFIED_CONTAM: hypothetical protein K2H54_058376 [Gekko kuhli]